MKRTTISESRTERLERSVLGTLLLTHSKYYDVSKIVDPVMFHGQWIDVANVIWQKMGEEGRLDSSLIALECEKVGVPQIEVLSLINSANPDYVLQQAQKIKEAYITDQEIILHEKALRRLRSSEPTEQVLADELAEREILQGFEPSLDESKSKKIKGFLEKIEEARKRDRSGQTIGIPTGLPGVDAITGGWQLTNYIVLAGRPGMGKTTGTLTSYLAAIENNVPALFISLEMSYDEILAKLIQKKAGVTRLDMQRGKITDQDFQKIGEASEHLSNLPFFIETGCYQLHQVKDKIRMYARKYGVKLVIIDYLQLLSISGHKGNNRNNEIEQISRALKQVASESDSNLTMIALSQLNRAVEQRGGTKRPQMSDLRDSGSIEQDADLIGFWYRPDYYQLLEDEEGNDLTGCVELFWTKNRHNPDGLTTCKMRYNKQYDNYEPWTTEEEDFNQSNNDYQVQIEPPKVDDNTIIPF